MTKKEGYKAVHKVTRGGYEQLNMVNGAFLLGIYDPLFADLQKIGVKSRGSQPQVRCDQVASWKHLHVKMTPLKPVLI